MADFSRPDLGGIGTAGTALCAGYVSLASALLRTSLAERRVHPPMGTTG